MGVASHGRDCFMRPGLLKSWTALLSVLGLLFHLLPQEANACVSFPEIHMKNGCVISFDQESSKEEMAVLSKLRADKERCGLNESDTAILTDYVLNGYSIKEATDEEYQVFLQETKRANARLPKDCLAYEAVSHRGRWTGCVETGLLYHLGECLTPKCVGASVQIRWNDLPDF